MISLFSHHKLMTLSFTFAMVFVLARVLTVISHFSVPENVPVPAAAPSVPKVFPKRIPKPGPEKHIPVKHTEAVAPVDENSLHLNTNLREYNVIFAGQVLCNQQPCQAELEFKMNTVRNENMHRVIETMEDGNFWIQVPVTENTNEHVDWKISARLPNGKTVETHGRDILSEDAVLSINAPLSFH